MKSSRGFTLVEMLIVVVIIGILARIAWPYYLGTTLKSGRSDAKVALNEVAQRLQRCFTASSTYAPTTTGVCTIYDTITSAAGFTSEQGFYVVKRAQATDITANTFLITATPVSTKRQAKDLKCATITLDQRGIRSAKDSGGTVNDTCW